MATGEGEARLLVQGQSHGVAFERDPGMASFTVVLPWRAGKLPSMRIFMTIYAQSKADFEPGLISRWYVTLRALHSIMRRRQGKLRPGVLGRGECRW